MEKPFYFLVLFGGLLSVYSYPMNSEEENRGRNSSQEFETDLSVASLNRTVDNFNRTVVDDSYKRSKIEKSKKSFTQDDLNSVVNPTNAFYGFDNNYFDGFEGAYIRPSSQTNTPSSPSLYESAEEVRRSTIPVPPFYYDHVDDALSQSTRSVIEPKKVETRTASKRNPFVDPQQLLQLQYNRQLGIQHREQLDMQHRQQMYMKNLQRLEQEHALLNPRLSAFSMLHPRSLYMPQPRMLFSPYGQPLRPPVVPSAMFGRPPQQMFVRPPQQMFVRPPQQQLFMPMVAPRFGSAAKPFPIPGAVHSFLHTPLKDLIKAQKMAKDNHESFPPSLVGLFELLNKDKPSSTGQLPLRVDKLATSGHRGIDKKSSLPIN